MGPSDPGSKTHSVLNVRAAPPVKFTMAKKVEKLKSTKRFGARYGPRNKIKLDKIERVQRSRQKCPYCSYYQVKRLSLGVWHCRKCNAKFTGKAYSVKEAIVLEEKDEETE